ncbi:MAG: hypothetical protein NC541_01620 [bacterium]|nr:hypothetical protein [bacterium]
MSDVGYPYQYSIKETFAKEEIEGKSKSPERISAIDDKKHYACFKKSGIIFFDGICFELFSIRPGRKESGENHYEGREEAG